MAIEAECFVLHQNHRTRTAPLPDSLPRRSGRNLVFNLRTEFGVSGESGAILATRAKGASAGAAST
ncbi:MAG: hypothetical protein WBQ79_12920, partial [Acidobacteriaceae bacterium]